MDTAEQVFDYVFELALAFDDGAHAFEVVGFGDALDQGYGVALGYMVEVEALGGFSLDAYLVDVDLQQVCHAGAHLRCNGADLRGGQDERGVDIDDAETGILQFFESQIVEDGSDGILPARVAGGKEAADRKS